MSARKLFEVSFDETKFLDKINVHQTNANLLSHKLAKELFDKTFVQTILMVLLNNYCLFGL